MSELTPCSCREAFERLDDYLDRELTPDEMRMVQEHLNLCQKCAKAFAFESRLLEQMKCKVRHLSIPPDLSARVLAAIEEVQRES
jgi:anti-sigma factor (TIGR02949 family)